MSVILCFKTDERGIKAAMLLLALQFHRLNVAFAREGPPSHGHSGTGESLAWVTRGYKDGLRDSG